MDPNNPQGLQKIPINKTCNHFRSATSISILEPMVRMYQMTKDKKYLDFAEYILKNGQPFDGANLYGNIFELAKTGKFPYEYFDYPHGYTLMSCFEGLIEYYRVTGDQEWLQAIYNFYYALKDSDVTVLGATGCSVEILNNAVLRQTTTGGAHTMHDVNIQEGYANVTWIKLNYQMLRLTGDPGCVDEIERAAYNMLLGTLNSDFAYNAGHLWNHTTQKYNGGRSVFSGFSPLNGVRTSWFGGERTYPSSPPVQRQSQNQTKLLHLNLSPERKVITSG